MDKVMKVCKSVKVLPSKTTYETYRVEIELGSLTHLLVLQKALGYNLIIYSEDGELPTLMVHDGYIE